jgi:hypothetical protein
MMVAVYLEGDDAALSIRGGVGGAGIWEADAIGQGGVALRLATAGFDLLEGHAVGLADFEVVAIAPVRTGDADEALLLDGIAELLRRAIGFGVPGVGGIANQERAS